MRKFILFIFFALLLSACNSKREQGRESAEESFDYIQTSVESVAETKGFEISPVVIDSIESVCQGSSVIAKATYLGYHEFSSIKNVYLFEVEDEFTNLINDKVIHVYESKDASFISGKTYYLFLNGLISSFYPHTVYSRYAPSCLIGEDEDGYTFYNGKTLGLDAVEDIDQYIKSEIIDKGFYNKDTAYLEYESIESACDNAAVILIATALSVEESSSLNPYIRYSEYSVDRVLKGEDLYYEELSLEGLSDEIIKAAGLGGSNIPIMQSPAETKIGDKFVLLFKIDPESQQLDMYSFQNSIFRLASDEGRFILERFE